MSTAVVYTARARLTRHEHELGDCTRARRVPDRRLQGVIGRELVGYQHTRAQFQSWLEPPRPELTLMIDLDGDLCADGEPLPAAWVGGLSETYTVVGFGETYGSIDLKLGPVGAYRLIGLPLSELTGACVSLDDVFGAGGAELAERLRELRDWDERFDLLESFLLRRLAAGPSVDPAIAWAWERLATTSGRVRIEALAAELGASRRYLTSRFHRQLGLPPKTVARLLRFADVRRRIELAPSRWAQIAFDAGYADQSHLNREFRELAGTTPSEFLARRIPDGGLIGDGCAPAA
ncbi:MAG: helix-turn-helix domain-containing protein [Solirubrobacteraceae bacterium]